ncbi:MULTISPECIES: hypothetical protein [unclassified Sphingopyxis]|uniref:hypothetical protein n=1 Tax=unclassified Sphingopyxis TaxID=2614943 RepID=UPI0028552F74|nr:MULTISPECIES: hypothetical protein [unclassified Sphingopyxis]MDR7058768.1 hypothetical protein [Sphingopyxis sp. BE235]MDR7179046.1 hypothetical protein [Sphingopyxis sp. BE249]
MTKATIQYRQLKLDGLWPDADLKAMVVDVLRRRGWADNAKTRIIDLDQDQSYVILNKLSDPATWDSPVFAGQLIQLQAGTDVHAVLQSLEEDTAEYVVQNLNVGEAVRVLKGALYFVAVGNHVGLIEGQQVRGRTLERYLTALLQRAEEIEPGQAIILNGKFMAGDGKELSESSEIQVSAAATNRQGERKERPIEPRVEQREAAEAREHEQATVFDILRMLGWSEEAIDSLGAEIPDDGWVEGFFKVFIKERRRRKPISRATINEALRNIDPADLGLRGDGSERGGIVKMSVQRDIRTAGSLLDPADAMEQITNALRDWAVAGKIDCNFEG